MTTTINLNVLGPLLIENEHHQPIGIGQRKHQALLAYLAVEHQRAHSRESLLGLLWPDSSPEKARLSLRVTLAALKKKLEAEGGAPRLHATSLEIQFVRNDCRLDVLEFAQALRSGDRHDHRRDELCDLCRPELARAVALYRGPFLDGLFLDQCQLFDEWLFLYRERLHVQVTDALTQLTLDHLRRGDWNQALVYARRQLELDPLREPAHQQIMQIHLNQGQRSDAIRQFELCRTVLHAELGIEPSAETFELYRRAVSTEHLPPVAVSVATPEAQASSRLPNFFTPFIGRQDELALLHERLADKHCRLITLVGAGGMGKTRLSVEAAQHQSEHFADGVYFVPFAGVQNLEAVIDTLAAALGVTFVGGERTAQQQLFDWLRPRQALLVLDNLEHLLAAAPLLVEMLHAAPKVKILVTSREPLGVQAEDQIAVTGLDVPSADDIESAGQYTAVRLFVDRAYRLNKRFRLSTENVADVVRICRLVEGRPLGLELAAVHTVRQSCHAIADAIVADLGFLAVDLPDLPPRQRSLRAVFEQSWQTLTPAEQSAFARLSIFRNPFGLDAAIAVAGASLPILTRLSNTHLIEFHDEDSKEGDRFRIHELLRQFAAAKLAEMLPNHYALERRHAEYFLIWLSRQDQIRNGIQPRRCAETIQSVLDDVRAAWQWASSTGALDLPARALPVLASFYTLRGMHAELDRMCRMTLTQTHENEVALRAQLLIYLGSALEKQGKVEEAHRTLNQGIELAAQSESFEALGFGYLSLARLTVNTGTIADALSWVQRGLDALPVDNFPLIRTDLLLFQGTYESTLGNLDRDKAVRAFAEARTILAQTGNQVQEQRLLYYEALEAIYNNYPVARFYLEQALSLSAVTGDRMLETRINQGLGFVHERLGDYEKAVHFHLRGLSLSTADQDSMQQTFGLHNLCLCYDQMGQYTEAFRCGRQGLAIAERDRLTMAIGYMNLHLGHVMAKMSLLHEASHTLQTAQATFVASNDLNLKLEAEAYLAHVEHRLDRLPAALAYVEQVLDQLEPRVLIGMDAPERVYLYCYQVLSAAKDSCAQAILDAAYLYIQSRAALLEPAERERFLGAVPANREIVAAWKAQFAPRMNYTQP
ncbi:hypothetical protein GC175_00495 [bacterium]|nr:hypothetical protein [bacterium]